MIKKRFDCGIDLVFVKKEKRDGLALVLTLALVGIGIKKKKRWFDFGIGGCGD